MQELTLEELQTLIGVFHRAGVTPSDNAEGEMLQRLQRALEVRQEIESLEFDDCLGGACKL